MVQDLFLGPIDTVAGKTPVVPIEENSLLGIRAEIPEENLTVSTEADSAL